MGVLISSSTRPRRPRLAKTLAPRAVALLPLHHRQINLLRQWRDCDDPELKDACFQDLLLTINAIASGLRTTG